ncbi:MAG: hypothetical protein M3N16_02025 [Actinomycetota bacterium]|nr:hypothetical protein [Actinomycetota bacterium]
MWGELFGARGFIDYAIELGRRLGRRTAEEGDHSKTAHAWLVSVRTFFRDICTWGTEPGSPFAAHMPRAVPLERHHLRGVGFEQARRREEARMAATVLDLEREVPKIRAYALRRWHEAEERRRDDPAAEPQEHSAFWDWALLELLVQSGPSDRGGVRADHTTSCAAGWPTGGSTTCSTSSRRSSTAPA